MSFFNLIFFIFSDADICQRSADMRRSSTHVWGFRRRWSVRSDKGGCFDDDDDFDNDDFDDDNKYPQATDFTQTGCVDDNDEDDHDNDEEDNHNRVANDA